jgi:sugar transferase (PEP-CTERM system associated)
MVRILRHYIHRQTLCHISLDLSLLGLLLLAAFLYSSAATHFAHPVLLLGAALMATGVSALRVRPVARPRVLVYGCGPQAMQVGRLLQSASPRVNLVGYYAGQTPGHLATTHAATAQPNLFCSGTSLAELARKERIQQIVVAACKHPHDTQALGELLDCRQRGLQVLDLAAHFEHTLGQIRHDAVSTRWLVRGEGFVHSHLRSCTCQLLDLVGASLLLLLALPVMLLAAVLIRLESGGPVFYRQERVGLHGRTFNMLKFRSMRTDAEPDGQARWASPGDARVTRVGRFLRKRRIDELPQLLNVLRGHMSLVGPRPERPCFVHTLAQKLPHYGLRHSVKPGITGWAQVRFHYAASVDDAAQKLQYDLYYVKNQCLLLDLVILFDTVGVVLTCQGAQ